MALHPRVGGGIMYWHRAWRLSAQAMAWQQHKSV